MSKRGAPKVVQPFRNVSVSGSAPPFAGTPTATAFSGTSRLTDYRAGTYHGIVPDRDALEDSHLRTEPDIGPYLDVGSRCSLVSGGQVEAGKVVVVVPDRDELGHETVGSDAHRGPGCDRAVVAEDSTSPNLQASAHFDGHPSFDDACLAEADLGASGDAEVVPEADLAAVAKRRVAVREPKVLQVDLALKDPQGLEKQAGGG